MRGRGLPVDVKCVLISHSVVVHNLPTVPGREGGCVECGSTDTTIDDRGEVLASPQYHVHNGIPTIYNQLHLERYKEEEQLESGLHVVEKEGDSERGKESGRGLQ